MWTPRSEKLANTRGMRFTIELDSRPATFSDVVLGWQTDAGFRTLFNGLLADAPFTAFRWETPAVTTATLSRPFEFVVLDSPGLARRPDPNAFAEHFNDAENEIAIFTNLSKDAILIVPHPVGEATAYGHLAAFVRLAPVTQRQSLWSQVGATLEVALRKSPFGLARLGPEFRGYTFGLTTDRSIMVTNLTPTMSSLNEIVTDRLILNMPAFDDAKAIFETYASDPAVTAYVGWPRHRNIDDTSAFLEFANAEWSRFSIGPYLIRERQDGALIGSTGISSTGTTDAMTGYVLAEAYWGKGFATEVVRAMIGVAHQLELHSLFALCHPEHRASRRVLEKTGFRLDSTWSKTITFPNLAGGQSTIPVCYRQSLKH